MRIQLLECSGQILLNYVLFHKKIIIIIKNKLEIHNDKKTFLKFDESGVK